MIVVGQEEAGERVVAGERANAAETHAVPDLHAVAAGGHERARVRAERERAHVGAVAGRAQRVQQLGLLDAVQLLAHGQLVDLELVVLQQAGDLALEQMGRLALLGATFAGRGSSARELARHVHVLDVVLGLEQADARELVAHGALNARRCRGAAAVVLVVLVVGEVVAAAAILFAGFGGWIRRRGNELAFLLLEFFG